MKKEEPKRKHPRLKGYDYSQNGAYFITFCVKDRLYMLGEVVGRDALGAPIMRLSEYGKTLQNEIEETPLHYDNLTIDNYVIMPNHVHMIVAITGDGAPRASRPTALVPRIVAIIKRKTNKIYGFDMWQTSYHDHIIRDEAEYLRTWQYIDENPADWAEDEYNIRQCDSFVQADPN